MPKLSRRHMVMGGTALAALAVVVNKPGDKSGSRDPYFLKMQDALKAAKIATPTLIIDKARLDKNIDTLMSFLPEGMGYRIVTKSLPSPKLIDYIAKRSGTNRLMVFNQPLLSEFSKNLPSFSQLLGKPMPIQAARNYFEKSGTKNSQNIEWLIDTPERLEQYAALAQQIGQPLNVNIELDVGLHRGGFVSGDKLGAVLGSIKNNPSLQFAGFMGYEPHVPKLPTALGMRDKALKTAWDTYSKSLSQAGAIFGTEHITKTTRNAAGSPTYKYYKDTHIANEVAVGSGLVKPADFDTELLSDHVPAAFIASPVIKTYDKTNVPGLEATNGLRRVWNPNEDKSLHIYGGNWMAKPVDPPGLKNNSIVGYSSNQELYQGGSKTDIQVDDFVFFRPKQSEAVFLQFGDIAIYDGGKIIEYWPVYPSFA